ncbi:inverse autotransporter beta domain-containing protein [Enterobacter asburiae]|uniref:inverse autotransporter beta domain-containing protein n=1 Tax=Enterobacter asburiae TaxID=61645 RepID=UPI0013B3B129|nr:inverse autotransporter beta domain-containing protein [Enterobacter asburiae]
MKKLKRLIFILLFSVFNVCAYDINSDNTSLTLNEHTHSSNGQAMLTNLATDRARSIAEDWFSQYGTVDIQLNSDRSFNVKNSSGDFLLGFYVQPEQVLYTQAGLRHDNDRLITNLGVGYRKIIDDWLFGYNLFYDSTWHNRNSRWGAGLELWRDYLKVSTNIYQRITGWHESQQHEGFLERPANGMDIRAEGWLPSYPQLGGNLIYEHYNGENVAISGFEDRSRKPTIITAGLKYTPFPLINLGVDYKRGSHNMHEARYNLGISWRLGESLAKQLDPLSIRSYRELAGSKLDLVNRNNNVVLDFKEKDHLSLSLPSEIRADENTVYTLTPVIKSKYSVKNIEIDDAALLTAGGKILSSSPQAIMLRMPSWQNGQGVVLGTVAVDVNGNRSARSLTRIWPENVTHNLSLIADKTIVVSDGNDAATLTLYAKDINGQPLVNEEIQLSSDGGLLSSQQGKTDEQGKLVTRLTSTTPGVFHVSAVDGEYHVTHPGITFSDSIHATSTVSKTEATANGRDAIEIRIKLTDSLDHGVVGKSVQWSSSFGTLSSLSTLTGPDGTTSVTVTSEVGGQAVVEARVEDVLLQSPVLNFREAEWVLSLKPDRYQALANGYDKVEYTLTVRNGNGALASGERVNWHTNLGEFTENQSALDSNGQARIKLRSTQTGTARVQATVAGHNIQAEDVSFTEVYYYFMSMPSVAKAGMPVTAIAYSITDNDGTIPTGEPVTWSSSGGILSASSVPVNIKGESSVTFIADKPGQYYVSSTFRHNTHRALITVTP